MNLESPSVQQISPDHFMNLMKVFDQTPRPWHRNIFRPAYFEAAEFMNAGLTPAIFIDMSANEIFVTSEEKIQNKMH